MHRRSRSLLLFTFLFTALAHVQAAPRLAEPMASLADSLPLVPGELGDDDAAFRFAIIGDRTGGDWEDWSVFDAAVDQINLLRPDFAIMIGDQIEGYTTDETVISDEWQTFLEHAGRLEVPLFMLPGNHDVTTPELVEAWKRRHGATYYSFDYYDAHFVVLNTEEERFGSMSFGDEQMDFLRDDLSRNGDAEHTFLFMHRPAWRNCMRPQDMDLADDWEEISHALGERPWTAFSGHRHWLMYDEQDGNRRFVVGPTGGSLRSPGVRQYGKFHHWTLVSVEPDTVKVAIMEPEGPVWPQDVATADYICAAKRVVELDSAMPERTEDGSYDVSFTARVKNRLPDTANVRIMLRGRGWPQVEGPVDTTLHGLIPGEQVAVPYRFLVPADRIPERPEYRFHTTIPAGTISSRWDEVPFVPERMLEVLPGWKLAGPFAGTDVRAASCDGRFTKMAEPWPDGRIWFTQVLGAADNTTGFARTTVISDLAQTVWAEYWAYDDAEIRINGRVVEESRVRGVSDREPIFIPLTFHEGVNTITVKVSGDHGHWGFGLRLADEAGTVVGESEVQTEEQDDG